MVTVPAWLIFRLALARVRMLPATLAVAPLSPTPLTAALPGS